MIVLLVMLTVLVALAGISRHRQRAGRDALPEFADTADRDDQMVDPARTSSEGFNRG